MKLFSLSLILFLIMDPLGHILPYLDLVKEIPPKRQRWIVFREMVIALVAMLIFNELGEVIFQALGFSDVDLLLASALILFLVAIKIIFPAINSPHCNTIDGEPFVFPLAIPYIAGPALLTSIMLYAHLEESSAITIYAILIAWAFASMILLCSSYLVRFLGKNGLEACERLTGMILLLLAIQRFTEGLQLLLT